MRKMAVLGTCVAPINTLGFSQDVTGYDTDDNLANEVAFRALGSIYYSDRAKEDAEAHAVYQKQLAQ